MANLYFSLLIRITIICATVFFLDIAHGFHPTGLVEKGRFLIYFGSGSSQLLIYELFTGTLIIESTRLDRAIWLKVLVYNEFGVWANIGNVLYFEAKVEYASLTVLRFEANVTIEMPYDLLGNKQA